MAGKMGGIDWASEVHALCVVDETGARVRERMIDHDEAGIAALCRQLVALEVERVAIERPDGILVDRLLEIGITVIAVHPNHAKAARERYSVARGKSDAFDAFVLAELARTDAHRLRAIRPDGDETKALRVLTRTREDLVGVRVELAKRLRVAVATLADSTRHWHPWAKEVYARARARGQDHPHAIRTLGRAWLRVLWRCWQDEVPYDPVLHRNFRRLQPEGG